MEAAVINARAFLKIVEDFGSFDNYVWPFVGGKVLMGKGEHPAPQHKPGIKNIVGGLKIARF